jgi:hypothetical protein
MVIAYVNLPNDIYYSVYFPEVLLEDGNSVTGVAGPAATFSNPVQLQYGSAISGNMAFTYPFDTTVTGLYYDYKLTIVWPSINSLTFGSYSVLWADSINNQIVLAMPSHTSGYAETISVAGLVNPYPYQRQIYQLVNSITLTFFS